MTVKETAQVLAAISSAYPNHDRFASEQAVEGMAKIWAATFAEDDAKLVQLAVAKHIQTNKWPPSIAEIREIIMSIQCPDLIPPDEAWIAVTDLLYVDESGHNTESLPAMIKKAAAAVGWSTLRELRRSAYTGGRPGLDRVAFMDIYKPLYERERQRMQLAPGIRSKIDKMTEAMTGEDRKKIENYHTEREHKEELIRQLTLHNYEQLITAEQDEPDPLGIENKEEQEE